MEFINADLTGADFTGADLMGVDFTGATLTDAIFDDANVQAITCPNGDTNNNSACSIEQQI